MPNKTSRRPARRWASLPDSELLKVRLRDLGLTLEDTWLKACLDRLSDELAERGLRVRPHGWLSDEWFSPVATLGIAFPFYLAHPRLMRLERKMCMEVEGGTRAECMRILRHEAGHVVQHAFSLHRRRSWQEHFGRSSQRYPNYYRPNPASRNFVQHLRLWYAQSHPDEDFAETFAVWLSGANWRIRYAGWGALRKLEYVDALMTEIAGERPRALPRRTVDPLSRFSRTLGEHYERKLEHYAPSSSRAYDKDLLRIFSDDPRHRRGLPAATFIRRYRTAIRKLVSRWSGEHELTVESVIDEMIRRARELDLRLSAPEGQVRLDFIVLLTARVVHSLHSPARRQWIAL
jgi:hypothetical protein